MCCFFPRLCFPRQCFRSLLLAGLLVPGIALAGGEKDAREAAGRTPSKPELVKVVARGITLEVPRTWKQQKPKNRLRLTQFALPSADGDTEKTELAVFVFPGGGTIEQNLPRWVSEFDRAGLSVRTTKGTSSQGPYVVGDLSGTHRGSSFNRRPTPLENGRVIGLILMPEGQPYYYLKMTGPEKSVEAAARALRAAIGADLDREEKLQVGT